MSERDQQQQQRRKSANRDEFCVCCIWILNKMDEKLRWYERQEKKTTSEIFMPIIDREMTRE